MITPETQLGKLLASLVEAPPHRLPQSGKAMRDLLRDHPAGFLEAALPILAAQPRGDAVEILSNLVTANGMILDPLLDSRSCSLEEARRIAGTVQRAVSSLDLLLLKAVWNPDGGEPRDWMAIARVLEILAALPGAAHTLPHLLQIMRSANPRIRSKIVLLFGRARRDPGWLAPYLNDPDPRIRANAVEAIWGLDSPQALRLFRQAAQDTNHRAAANALVGLYLAGDRDAALQLEQMASFSSPVFQAAAAWAMGRCGNPCFAELLLQLHSSPDSRVRRAALKALVRIRKSAVLSSAALSD